MSRGFSIFFSTFSLLTPGRCHSLAFLFYHTQLRLSSPFPFFFQKVFPDLHPCQADSLFILSQMLRFVKCFFLPPGSFFPFLSSAFGQLRYITISIPICQYFSSIFFEVFRKLRDFLICRYIEVICISVYIMNKKIFSAFFRNYIVKDLTIQGIYGILKSSNIPSLLSVGRLPQRVFFRLFHLSRFFSKNTLIFSKNAVIMSFVVKTVCVCSSDG